MALDVATIPPPTRLDRLIAWATPSRALRRERARLATAMLRAYEGAARSRRTEGWRTQLGTGANAELAPALPLLRDRARDHVRNNPYGRRIVRALSSALVGYGITGTVAGPNKRSVAALQGAWASWCNATTCDQRGKQSFAGLTRLVARTFCESGEAIVRRVWDASAPFGFRVLVQEGDHLDALGTMYMRPPFDGHRIVAGVELDGNDRPVAYWLTERHPGDTWAWAGAMQTPTRVPAADVAHVYDEERAGQGRGCPLLAPVEISLRDLDECRDAQQVLQKIAACFAVFYTTPEGAVRSKAQPLVDRVEPGMVEELPPGYEVTVGQPPDVGGYGDVMRIGLQACAAGTGVPYEEISGDFSQFNFSSGRMSRGAYYAMVEELQWQVLVPGFCDRVFAWFLDAARIAGYDTAGVSIVWTMPRRPLVDPSREITPAIDAVRATLSSPQEAIRELGYEPEAVLREWQQFTRWLDDMGLVSDIDPRRTTHVGLRVTPADEPPAALPPGGPGTGVRGKPNGHDTTADERS
jgi:lambda family phage portal protein